MSQIQYKLHQLHSLAKDNMASSTGRVVHENRAESDPKPFIPPPPPEAFLKVEQVVEGSPAYRGGLRNHDLILRMGTVTATNFSGNLSTISNLLSGYQGQVIGLEVSREECDRPIRLSLTPQLWSGRGLLGCKMVPLLKP